MIKALFLQATLILLFSLSALCEDISSLQPFGQPEGADANAIFNYKDNIYLATGNSKINGGIYKYDGSEWILLLTVESTYFTSISASDNEILIGTNNKGVYKSTDGKTFSLITDGLIDQEFGIITTGDVLKIVNADNNNYYMLSENNGFYSSSDAGNSWILAKDFPNTDKLIFEAFDGKLFMSDSLNHLIMSEDRGKTWDTFASGLNPNFQYHLLRKINNTYYIAYSRGLQQYSNELSEWSAWNNDSLNYLNINSYPKEIYEHKDNIYLLTHNNIYTANKDSLAWEKTLVFTPDSMDISIQLSSEIFFSTTNENNHIFNLEDLKLEDNNKGLSNVNCKSFLILDKASFYIYGDKLRNIKRKLAGDNKWETLKYWFLQQPLKQIINIGDKLFAIGKVGFFYSGNFGDTWQFWNVNQIVQEISFLYHGEGMLFLASQNYKNGTFRRTDGQNNWEETNLPLDDNLAMTHIGEFVYAIISKKGLYRSSDNGINWTDISKNISDKFEFDNFTDISSDGSNLVITRNTGEIYVSSDLGDSWSLINETMPVSKRNNVFIYEDLIITDRDEGGIEYTEDNGKTWLKYDFMGFDNVKINDIILHETSLYFLTNNQGIWKTNFYKSVGEISLTSNIKLSPIPAQNFLNIDFSEQSFGNINVSIYNLSGQKILDLYQGYKSTVDYKNQFDISSLSAGSYYLLINLDGLKSFEKFVVWE